MWVKFSFRNVIDSCGFTTVSFRIPLPPHFFIARPSFQSSSHHLKLFTSYDVKIVFLCPRAGLWVEWIPTWLRRTERLQESEEGAVGVHVDDLQIIGTSARDDQSLLLVWDFAPDLLQPLESLLEDPVEWMKPHSSQDVQEPRCQPTKMKDDAKVSPEM